MTTISRTRQASGISIFIQSIAALALRVALALPFWQSGVTRWQDFLQLRPETLDMYSGRYEPNVFGNSYSIMIPYPEITALVASAAELMLPAALVIGFATRLSALGIFIMTLIIFTTYQTSGVGADLWQTQTLPWAAMALMLIAFGPGRLCFDNLIARNFRRR